MPDVNYAAICSISIWVASARNHATSNVNIVCFDSITATLIDEAIIQVGIFR